MLFLLLRHADAGVSDPAKWPGDVERPLTDVGRETQRRVSETLLRAGLTLDALCTSPLLRARQTAEIVAGVFGLRAPVTVCEALAQPPDLRLLANCIGKVSVEQTIGLTGHSPLLDETASLLLTGSPAAMKVDFPKSGAMVIRAGAMEPGAGQLIAFLSPPLAAT
jgi:phosphohistidine phosphatase